MAVTEFNYRKAHEEDAHVLVGIRTTSEASFSKLKQKLKKLKYKFSDYTNNEISNDHLRHMVGGRANNQLDAGNNERIFKCEFPQKPGVLLSFLENFGSKRSISLFHYRDLGSAFAKILIGIEDNENDKSKLLKHLDKSGTSFTEETSNKAYKDFLK